MDAFSSWNLTLLRSFFSLGSGGDQVWLAVDPDELWAIAPELGGDQGLLEAVRSGPSWPTIWDGYYRYASSGTTVDLVQRAMGMLIQRQRAIYRPPGYIDPGSLDESYEGLHAPPYLPILAVLVRNSALQEDNSYYPALRAELGLPETWSSNEMRALIPLWEDLDRWTASTGGRFGRFTYRSLGTHRFIGIPRSQIVISRRDAKALTRLFAQAGVRGGQKASPKLLQELVESARGMLYLSSPFRQALEQPEFREPIADRIASILDDWDGVVIGPAASALGNDDSAQDAASDLEVALGLADGNNLPWEVRWRVPAVRDAGRVFITTGGGTWEAEFAGTEAVTTEPTNDVNADAARVLLARSANEEVSLDLSIKHPDTPNGQALGEVVLRRRPLRYLVPVRESVGQSARRVLLERPLPSHGPAYLLAPPGNAGLLRQVLQQVHIRHAPCPADGLPEGWVLFLLPECAEISDAQRDQLPDGYASGVRTRTIRLVGGRPIQRAGVRQYLSFDLPSVELDAPDGTMLVAPGLRFTPQVGNEISGGDGGGVEDLSTVRRFDVEIAAAQARTFEIRAMFGGEVLDTVRLRLAPESGLEVASGTSFAVDPRGNPIRGGDGLKGVLPESGVEPSSSDLTHANFCVDVGWPAHSDGALEIKRLPAARFLYTLSQLGSMALGPARDHLRRLCGLGSNPYDVLRELRGRGFLEIEANSKGHWVRVHAVPPFIYVLPVTARQGSVVASLGGTMPLQQWDVVCDAASHGLTAMRELEGGRTHLRAVRLVAPSLNALREFASDAKLNVVIGAAQRVAAWAAGIDEVGENIMAAGVESLGAAVRQVERFMPAQGRFVPSPSRMSLLPGPSSQLFQVEDMETGSHWIYVLGYRTETATTQYTFVRDARWGIWLALASAAKWAQAAMRRDDLHPWPLHYDSSNRTLWLPSRLNLPVVLERALLLCSGAPPIAERVCSTPVDEGVGLSRFDDGRDLGVVSYAYQDYVPKHPESARWLGYRWVPEEIAREVASKLGAALRPLLPVPAHVSLRP